MVKTKARLDADVRKLIDEVSYYIDEIKRAYGELINGFEEGKAISREEHEKLKDRYNELLKRHELLTEEIETLRAKASRTHNERGAGRKAKITVEMTRQIKEMRAAGSTYPEIANAINLSIGAVYKAANS